jgi:hypothetical protein
MARKINRLNARAVATMMKYGRHADGGGLYLSMGVVGGFFYFDGMVSRPKSVSDRHAT